MINPMSLITLAYAGGAIVATLAGGLLMAWCRSPEIPIQSLLSPVGLICYSHDKLAQLQPTAPNVPDTLFSILHIDSSKAPFHPPDACAYPYSPNYKKAKQAITNAWADMSDNHDGNMREWRDVFSAAAVTLLNDTSRIMYMKDVLPNLEKAKGKKGASGKFLQEFCGKK
ncbi:hypothetical protein ACHAPT_013044 [Fusarium lateritium]